MREGQNQVLTELVRAKGEIRIERELHPNKTVTTTMITVNLRGYSGKVLVDGIVSPAQFTERVEEAISLLVESVEGAYLLTGALKEGKEEVVRVPVEPVEPVVAEGGLIGDRGQ